jgi:hypothetical protein
MIRAAVEAQSIQLTNAINRGEYQSETEEMQLIESQQWFQKLHKKLGKKEIALL